MLLASGADRDVVWKNNRKIICYNHIDRRLLNNSVAEQTYAGYRLPEWGRLDIANKPLWEYNCEESVALAVCKNAVVVANTSELTVLSIRNGKILWTQLLDYAPVPWGLAVGRDGRIIVTLEDGQVQGFGGEPTLPIPYISSNNLYFVGSTHLTLRCDTKGAEIRYTTDGCEPTQTSKLYTKPFEINESTIVKMRTFKDNMVQSFVVTEEVKKIDYRDAVLPGQIERGLLYDYYEGVYLSVDQLDRDEPVKSGIKPTFDLRVPEVEVERFGFEYNGFIKIPKDGIYTFYIESNDGSKLYLDGNELIDNDGDHTAIEKYRSVALRAGMHPIAVKYYQAGASKCLNVNWEGSEFARQEIPASILFHKVRK